MRRLEEEFRVRPELHRHATTIAEYLHTTLSPATATAAEKRFIAFISWAEHVDCPDRPQPLMLPVEPDRMLRYARHLDSKELSPQTIYSYLWAIGSVHRALDYYEPTHHPTVKKFLAEPRHERDDTNMFRASSLSEDQLISVLNRLRIARRTRGGRPETHPAMNERAGVDKALLLTMTQAGLRRGEASRLTWEDIETVEDGSGRIRIPPKANVVAITWDCMRAIEEIQFMDGKDSAHVFGLSGSQISRRLKTMCAAAGIDPANVRGDTPRATLARLLTERDAPQELIHHQLRLRPSYTHSPYFLEPEAADVIPWLSLNGP